MTQRRRTNPPSGAADASSQQSGRRRRVRPDIEEAGAGSRRRRRVPPAIEDAPADRGRPLADEPTPPQEPQPAGGATEGDGGPVSIPPAWWTRPMLRAGAYAWALIGLLAVAVAVGMAAGALRLVVVPLLLALFPAALLYPVCQVLRRWGLPPAVAAVGTLLGVLALLVGLGTILAPQVADEIPEMVESVQEGVRELENVLNDTTPFGIDAAEARSQFDDAVERIDTQAVVDLVRAGALGAAAAVAEIAVMTVLLLVVLFFYLKDGERLGRWVCNLFPAAAQADAEAVGLQAWTTIGAYFRGQILVALVDAIGIGIGLWVLGVPLALPLTVLVFFGGLFPIVGAVVTGVLAVLVALATTGPFVALGVLGIVLAIQQLESNVFAPIVLGRATALHPLAVLTAITAGGVLLGVLGAFLAIPVTASITRAVGTLRQRRAGSPAPAAPAAG